MSVQTQIYIMYGVLAISLFVFVYGILRHLQRKQVIQNSFNKLVTYAQSETAKRAEIIKQQEILDGELDASRYDFLTKLDNLIMQSNVKKFLPFLNAETYIIGLIVIACLSILLCQEFLGNFIYGLYIALILGAGSLTYLMVARNINHAKIEGDVIDFINLMENYSKTCNDIIDIFGKIYPYLNEPLRSLTQKCYLDGMRTGNITAALTEFEKSVNHKKLREIIHNISVCSRYDTDYEAVIGDSRKMLQDYLTGKAQERAILNSARIEYISIALIAGVLFWMIGDFMEVDLEQMLLHTTVGSAFIFYFIVVVFIAVLNLFIIEGGRD